MECHGRLALHLCWPVTMKMTQVEIRGCTLKQNGSVGHMCASLFVASAFASPIAFSIGEVATIYPSGATDEQKRTNKCARVEIFKMTGGTEYIVHDIDVNNIIVGKARFSGTVRVPDEMAVEGFLATKDVDVMNDDDEDEVTTPAMGGSQPMANLPQ
jgi:acetylornithine deacetylase/succinyl-diaminopimelate desuccinylase-like protein